MARITVEDCLKKIDSQYDLVLLAKERTSQLNAGDQALVPQENDKNTVIALREIGEGKVSVKKLKDSAINNLRKKQEETAEFEELDDLTEDSFDKIYKGEISKSGTAILPSKRTRRIPEKVILDTTKSDDESDEKKSDDKSGEKDEELKQNIDTTALSTDQKSK